MLTTTPLHCQLTAIASVGLGTSELKRYGSIYILIYNVQNSVEYREHFKTFLAIKENKRKSEMVISFCEITYESN